MPYTYSDVLKESAGQYNGPCPLNLRCQICGSYAITAHRLRSGEIAVACKEQETCGRAVANPVAELAFSFFTSRSEEMERKLDAESLRHAEILMRLAREHK